MTRFIAAAVSVMFFLSAPVGAQQTTSEPAQANPDERPQQIVDALHAGLLDIMKRGPELGFSGRNDVIAPVVQETFDIRILSATAIGIRRWSSWTQAQKDSYIDAFGRFMSANYARQFDSYSGQEFEFIALEPGPKSTYLVKTHINRPDKDPIELTYLTREREGRVGIIDVLLGGKISEAARRRSEFSVIYRDHGFDGLIASIENQIRRFEAETSADSG